jgi:phosphatidate cytidylyltransferase
MKIRLISSAVGIVIGILVLFFSDTIFLNFMIAFISVIMLTELFNANKCKNNKLGTYSSYVFAAVFPFLFLDNFVFLRKIFVALFLLIMFISYIINHKKTTFEKIFYMIASTFFVGMSLSCVYLLRNISEKHGVVYILLALCGAWIADSGAYFVGTFLGKHKLCPEISPKKTVEGFIGGLLSNGVVFVVINLIYVAFFAEGYKVNYVNTFVLGLICAVLGTIGDLTASLIKRQCNIKDYGNIMPGHGGLMDRFDSVLFVVPFIYVYLNYLNIYK